MKAPADETSPGYGVSCPLIKTSLSMTSLPPNDNQRDAADIIKAKLRIDRPYNSLKKKRSSHRDSWRHSWGSGQSHSSCSLHSNATAIGLSSGKDEFWAALQTNYNYIMDTHLLDSCREARCEIESANRTVVNTPECCSKMLQPSRTEGSPEDIKSLRRWLREKEDILAKAPTLYEATHMTTQQLQRLLSDHSVLYYDIVSHARVVNACVKASERDNSIISTERKKTPSPNGEHRISEENLKGLERRYHLLYLKAIEVQCLFEGLLGKRSSSSVLSRSSSTETDDEPASKVARYSEFEPLQESEHQTSSNRFNQPEVISDEIISEEEVDNVPANRKLVLSSPRRQRNYHHSEYRLYRQYSELNAVDFDADSEGSDFEVLNKENTRNSGRKDSKLCEISKVVKDDEIVLSESTMDSNCQKKTDPLVTENKLKIANLNWPNPKIAITTSGIVANNAITVTTVTPVVIAKKRQRTVDVSKFNRSNRKSKNCAIFYFKHLDTDNENFGLSSQGSDAIKSGDPSSDDEGWYFSNDCVDGNKQVNDDSDKENKKEIANSSDENQPNSLSTLLSTASVQESVISMDESAVKHIVDMSTPSGNISNEVNRVSPKVALVRSKEELNNKTVAVIRVERHLIDESSVSVDNAKSPESALSSTNEAPNKETINKLVLDAENLVRDELLKTPTKKHSTVNVSATVKKREAIIMSAESNLQKVQEWLEHQPQKTDNVQVSQANTDCEASGEYTESDSSHARDSDTSEGFTDSVATCMQTGGSNSQGTSTEIISGSAEPIPSCGSNLSLGKVVRRANKRNADRPWSVSCLSQLTETDVISPEKISTNQGLATHSISESALHIWSSPGHRVHLKDSQQTPVKSSESKGSLKRRKTRRRKTTSKRSDSGSEGLIQKLLEQQSISSNINIIEDLTEALSMISLPKPVKAGDKSTSELESEEDQNLPKPNFKVGPVTNPFTAAPNESKLGPLAALANYMNEEQGEVNTITDNHSSFSEQAWDNYQEKYNSENYSEGMDSDAARRLLEFGDDYRAYLDSQSDCCSSLSAANNFDSLSPPQMDSLKSAESKLPQPPPVSTVDHIRRRRALELEYERRREMKKRNSQDELKNNRSPHGSASSINNSFTKSGEKTANKTFADVVRRLDFEPNCSFQSRKTSESDNSVRRRKSEDSSTIRRRFSRTSEKAFKVYSPGSSSSNPSSDDEKEMKNLLLQSRNRLEHTNALKIRSHLLRPEDYDEIITTCRDNINCLNSILRGPPGTVLSVGRCNETRDLLSSWEHLLAWSENAAAARKMQEEMSVLKNALSRLGKQTCDLDSIEESIDELKTEKTQLLTYRTNMLRLNAAVHSWLTREELKLKREMEASAIENTNAVEISVGEAKEKSLQINTVAESANELHKHLKDEVSDMYSEWDKADTRISSQLESLTASLIAWRQLESGLSEFHQVLDEDRGALEGLEGALDRGYTTPIEIAQNVKLVAKLLSEKVDGGRQQVAVVSTDYTDQGRAVVQTTQFHTIITSSNGSLSDSGISDGGTTSDGGLSERERRLGVLRRLAKQLENALAPGSEALRSITARMESAESELKALQDTCRELIVRTSVSQNTKKCVASTSKESMPAIILKQSQRSKKSPGSKRKGRRKSSGGKSVSISGVNNKTTSAVEGEHFFLTAPDSGDPDDPRDDPLYGDDDNLGDKRGWAWRVARIAFPVQLAFLALFCASCLMEPHCCDSLNNFSMSFAPQLRYIRGPPPI